MKDDACCGGVCGFRYARDIRDQEDPRLQEPAHAGNELAWYRNGEAQHST